MQDNQWSINAETWQWPFGIHIGKKLEATPQTYLEWILKNFKKSPIKTACKLEIIRRSPDRAKSLGIAVVKSSVGSGSIQGRYDCSSTFDQHSDQAGLQPWDGTSAPWEDQIGCDELSSEFKAMFR